MLFRDRYDAGRQSAAKLGRCAGRDDVLVLALPQGGVRVLNAEVVEGLGIPPEVIDRVAEAETRELERREKECCDGGPAPDIHGV